MLEEHEKKLLNDPSEATRQAIVLPKNESMSNPSQINHRILTNLNKQSNLLLLKMILLH